MKINRIKFSIMLLAFLLLLGCNLSSAYQNEENNSILIGVSQPNLIEPWRIALHEELAAEAKKHPKVRMVFADAAGSSQRQVQDIHRFIQLEVDVIIISPGDAQLMDSIITQTDIPVIVLDQRLPSGNFTQFIGSDYEKIGALAANKIVALLGENGGSVLEITGQSSSYVTQAISDSFYSHIAVQENIRLITPIDGDWLRDTANMRMKDFLLTQDNPDVIFAHNDAMALGAYNAAKEFRKSGMIFIGIDGLKSEGERLVNREILYGTFLRNTGGQEAIENALLICSGEDVPKEIILEPIPIFNDFESK